MEQQQPIMFLVVAFHWLRRKDGVVVSRNGQRGRPSCKMYMPPGRHMIHTLLLNKALWKRLAYTDVASKLAVIEQAQKQCRTRLRPKI